MGVRLDRTRLVPWLNSTKRMPPAPETCVVTGTNGYLGGRVKAALEERGWRVLGLTRAPKPGSNAQPFQLGGEVAVAALAGAKALVHCAYDFQQLVWKDVRRVNVEGSKKLFQAAKEARTQQLVFISSISAFEGCRSIYGRAKLEIESLASSYGAAIIRPGLIWGEPPGAMFARLVKQVEEARVLPLLGGGAQIQHLVHDADLTNAICTCAEGAVPASSGPITVAHERPWRFREVLEEIARAKRKKISFVRFPWRAVWLVLKSAELFGAHLAFRSDSLVSLMHQNPSPNLDRQRELGTICRPFQFS